MLLFKLHAVQPKSSAVLHKFLEGEYSNTRSGVGIDVNLPHDWKKQSLRESRLWYRFSFTVLDAHPDLHALYLPVISQNAVVYLNGTEIGNGGSIKDPVARNWPRPMIFPIAADFLLEGSNELVLHVVSEPLGRGVLPVFYFGKWSDLLPYFDFRKMLKQTALGASVVILITVALFLFFITWHRKESSEYAWGAATFLTLSGHSLPVFFQHIPVPAFLWEWWQHLCIGYTILFMLIFVNRYFKVRMKVVEMLCTYFLIAVSALSFMFGNTPELRSLYFNYAGGLWGIFSLIMGTVPLAVTLSNAVGKINIPALYMLCVGTIMFILGLHDMLFVNGFLTRENGYLIHYASPLVALLLTTILISRLIETSKNLEELNNSLEQRIEKSNSALKSSYEKVRKMERDKILLNERERFNRDMHDGLGGHLSTALALAESNMGPDASLTRTIRAATDDMRLMIDTAEAMGEDVGMIIGSLRQKLQIQAGSAGFKLVWRIDDTYQIDTLGHGTALNLIRIVQEAVNNALKHSGGDEIRVSLQDKDGFIVLEIADNGVCSNLSRSHGNGINNLDTRANELGASINFNPCSVFGGLSVSIMLPSAISDHT